MSKEEEITYRYVLEDSDGIIECFTEWKEARQQCCRLNAKHAHTAKHGFCYIYDTYRGTYC